MASLIQVILSLSEAGSIYIFDPLKYDLILLKSYISSPLGEKKKTHMREKDSGNILECKVKWALGSIPMNKASGGDGIKLSYFKS